MTPAAPMELLHAMRRFGGPRQTVGLTDAEIERFLQRDQHLGQAIREAADEHERVRATHSDLLAGSEDALVNALQADIVNFYDEDAINPYVPLAARGPWIVTSHGAVLHDSGGYGMLGFGHAPAPVLEALARPWVIANVMTPSFGQRRLTEALRREIGHTRGGTPFQAFVFMNSGSESVSVAARISDIHAWRVTAPDGRFPARRVKFLAIEGGFHGRTDRPAQASASTRPKYKRHLASFQALDNLVTVPPNDIAALERAFAAADRDGVFFEMMLVEPVMGEGNPGMAMSREFYDAARRLCTRMGTLLLVDSIQAGLRAHGVLSIVDYPGFEDADPPDMETYSKAINAAQYPLSVLALGGFAAQTYQRGVYGNTMTANPRACEVGAATLGMVTPALRANVRDSGAELLAALNALMAEFPGLILGVQGTGLLLSAEIRSDVAVVGPEGLERWLRLRGMGVIHGGTNALRFTPHFAITSDEVTLMADLLREAFSVVTDADVVPLPVDEKAALAAT